MTIVWPLPWIGIRKPPRAMVLNRYRL